MADVESLDVQHIELARMISMGIPFTEIADRLGVSTYWVREHRKFADVENLVNELKEEALISAKARLMTLQDKAIDTMENLLVSLNDNVRANVAKDILDRTGVTKTEHKKIEIVDDLTKETEDQVLARLRNRMKAIEGEEE